jgi:hypothetical protein
MGHPSQRTDGYVGGRGDGGGACGWAWALHVCDGEYLLRSHITSHMFAGHKREGEKSGGTKTKYEDIETGNPAGPGPSHWRLFPPSFASSQGEGWCAAVACPLAKAFACGWRRSRQARPSSVCTVHIFPHHTAPPSKAGKAGPSRRLRVLRGGLDLRLLTITGQ